VVQRATIGDITRPPVWPCSCSLPMIRLRDLLPPHLIKVCISLKPYGEPTALRRRTRLTRDGSRVGMRILYNRDLITYNDNIMKKPDYLLLYFHMTGPLIHSFSQLSILTFVKSNYKTYFKSIFIYLYTQICVNLI
jgi:hypothetical protein